MSLLDLRCYLLFKSNTLQCCAHSSGKFSLLSKEETFATNLHATPATDVPLFLKAALDYGGDPRVDVVFGGLV